MAATEAALSDTFWYVFDIMAMYRLISTVPERKIQIAERIEAFIVQHEILCVI